TNWNPLVSAFDTGGAPNAFHFQTQLSDGSIIVEGYYNQNNSGFGTYIKIPEVAPQPEKEARLRIEAIKAAPSHNHNSNNYSRNYNPGNFKSANPYAGFNSTNLVGYNGFNNFNAGLPAYVSFGPAYMADPRNKPWRFGRHENGRPKLYRMPFM